MVSEKIKERLMASAALLVNDRVIMSEEYAKCPHAVW
jgi:hypothetical protein